jgi:hypothetical protein
MRRVAAGTVREHDRAVDSLGKNLVVLGLVLAATGAVLWMFGRHGGGLLPGDIVIEKKNVRVYFPVVTCLIISLVLSAIAWLMRR